MSRTDNFHSSYGFLKSVRPNKTLHFISKKSAGVTLLAQSGVAYTPLGIILALLGTRVSGSARWEMDTGRHLKNKQTKSNFQTKTYFQDFFID